MRTLYSNLSTGSSGIINIVVKFQIIRSGSSVATEWGLQENKNVLLSC